MTSAGEMWEKKVTLCTVGLELGTALMENSTEIPQNIKNGTTL